jgi:hypothetical protein
MSISASYGKPPRSASYEPHAFANAFSASITHSSSSLLREYTGPPPGVQGKKSSRRTQWRSPFLNSSTLYTPSGDAVSTASPAPLGLNMRSTSRGCSATAASAHMSQQLPSAPWRMSCGSTPLSITA